MTMVGTLNYVDVNFVGSQLGGGPGTMQNVFRRNPGLANYLAAHPWYISLRPVIADITGGRPVFHAAALQSADYSVLAESLTGFVTAFPNLVSVLSYPVGRGAIPMLLFGGFASSDEAKNAVLYNASSPTGVAIGVPVGIAGGVGVDLSRRVFIVPNLNFVTSTESFPSQQDSYLINQAIGPVWFVEPTVFGATESNVYNDITKWIFPRSDNTNDVYAIAFSSSLQVVTGPTTLPPTGGGATSPPPSGGLPGGAASAPTFNLLDQPGTAILIAVGVGLVVWMVTS